MLVVGWPLSVVGQPLLTLALPSFAPFPTAAAREPTVATALPPRTMAKQGEEKGEVLMD